MAHIEPCPFCGHVGLDFSDGSTYRWGLVSCGGCGTSMEVRRSYPDDFKWHKEGVELWNTRVPKQGEPAFYTTRNGNQPVSPEYKSEDYRVPLFYTTPQQQELVGMTIEDEYVRNYLWERGLIAVDEDPKLREEKQE